jgi:hypothetical protein
MLLDRRDHSRAPYSQCYPLVHRRGLPVWAGVQAQGARPLSTRVMTTLVASRARKVEKMTMMKMIPISSPLHPQLAVLPSRSASSRRFRLFHACAQIQFTIKQRRSTWGFPLHRSLELGIVVSEVGNRSRTVHVDGLQVHAIGFLVTLGCVVECCEIAHIRRLIRGE